MDEHNLVKNLKNGDQSAFRELVLTYQDMVVNVCYRFLQNRENALDIAQEVFIEVYEKSNSFRGEAKISTWLYRIAANRSLNYIRNNKKHIRVLSINDEVARDEIGGIAEKTQNLAEQNERQNILESAIKGLPQNQQKAFRLSKIEEMSYKEIAAILETTISSVESLIHRAKLNLQKKLINYYKKVEI